MPDNHPIRCRCGQLRGTLAHADRARRLVCYCRDCQTAAHALGDAGRTLDAHGGTAIVAALQSDVSFTQGREHLASLSLTPRGIYRWYARCCRTPIANTVRRPQMSYVGLVHTGLGESAEAVARVWPSHFTVNTTHAKGLVPQPGFPALAGVLRIAPRVLGARLSGRWRDSPFFDPAGSGAPVSPVEVLPRAELERARAAV